MLKTCTGETVAVKGLAKVNVELNRQRLKLPLFVVEADYPSMKTHRLVARMLEHGETALEQILKKIFYRYTGLHEGHHSEAEH